MVRTAGSLEALEQLSQRQESSLQLRSSPVWLEIIECWDDRSEVPEADVMGRRGLQLLKPFSTVE